MEVCRLEVLLQYMKRDINKLILYYYICYENKGMLGSSGSSGSIGANAPSTNNLKKRFVSHFLRLLCVKLLRMPYSYLYNVGQELLQTPTPTTLHNDSGKFLVNVFELSSLCRWEYNYLYFTNSIKTNSIWDGESNPLIRATSWT